MWWWISIFLFFKEDPAVACGAMGLCKSEQMALAKVKAQEALMSNEIPEMDLAQRVAPFMLNVPQLLYPQENLKQETPKPEAPQQVLALAPPLI